MEPMAERLARERCCTECGKRFRPTLRFKNRRCCSPTCTSLGKSNRCKARNPSMARPSAVQAIGRLALIDLDNGMWATIDAEDVPTILGKRWVAVLMGGRWYAVNSFRDDSGLSRRLYLHQAILGIVSGKHIDHKNGDGLDNRKENLRHCNARENQQNRHVRCGKSRFKGVYASRYPGHWVAHVRIEGKMTHLGTFLSEEDAARAYDAAARKHFGEFAACNFADGDSLKVEIVGE
jgi:hypothetical protein